MRHDSRKTNHREPRDWIFGPITGQNAVPGQSRRFGHGDVNIMIEIINAMRPIGAPVKSVLGFWS